MKIMQSAHLMRAVTAGFLLMYSLTGRAEEQAFTVPNGDFESAGNNGSLGGGLISPLLSQHLTANPLASGPWSASSRGILGLLAPPRVVIDSRGAADGTCRITGLAAVNAAGGLVNNRASVSQVLSLTAEPWSAYTLEVDIDRSSVLTAALLSRDGTGAALTVGGTTVATSRTAAADFIKIELLSGTKYRLTLRYVTGDTAPAGNMGIRLFSGSGASLLNAGVLPDVVFDNVKLTINRLEA